MAKALIIASLFLVAAGCGIKAVEEPPTSLKANFAPPDPAFISMPAPEKVREFSGCYEFGLKLVDSQAKDIVQANTNLRAELKTAEDRTQNSLQLLLTPAPIWPTSWSIQDGEAVFWWSTGFTGFRFRILRGGGTPTALFTPFSDAGEGVIPSWKPISVKRVPCAI